MARQKKANTRILHVVNEHVEPLFNAANVALNGMDPSLALCYLEESLIGFSSKILDSFAGFLKRSVLFGRSSFFVLRSSFFVARSMFDVSLLRCAITDRKSPVTVERLTPQ